MSVNGINGASPISTGTKLPAQSAANPDKPQISERSQKSELLMERQVDRLDAFVDPDRATKDSIIGRLKSVANGETQQQLEAADSAMRAYMAQMMFRSKEDPLPPVNEGVKAFSHLWAAANKLEQSNGNGGPANYRGNLQFGPMFNLLIESLNGMEVSLSTRSK